MKRDKDGARFSFMQISRGFLVIDGALRSVLQCVTVCCSVLQCVAVRGFV